jgi:hypothetical protein
MTVKLQIYNYTSNFVITSTLFILLNNASGHFSENDTTIYALLL